MLTEMTPAQQHLFDLFGLGPYTPVLRSYTPAARNQPRPGQTPRVIKKARELGLEPRLTAERRSAGERQSGYCTGPFGQDAGGKYSPEPARATTRYLAGQPQMSRSTLSTIREPRRSSFTGSSRLPARLSRTTRRRSIGDSKRREP